MPLQELEIGEVPRPAEPALVLDQRLAADHEAFDAAVAHGHPPGPRRVELDARDRREDVDSPRWQADLEHDVRSGKIRLRQGVERGTERAERRMHATGILGCGIDPEIQVARGARLRVSRHGIGADDQKADLSVAEGA